MNVRNDHWVIYAARIRRTAKRACANPILTYAGMVLGVLAVTTALALLAIAGCVSGTP